MDVNKIKQELNQKYPNSSIFENRIGSEITEILCEVDPSNLHSEYSLAIAVIDRSLPHYHKESIETYKILKGKLILHLEDEIIELVEGDTYKINVNKVHWAEGNETWIECYCEPGWKFTDHILV